MIAAICFGALFGVPFIIWGLILIRDRDRTWQKKTAARQGHCTTSTHQSLGYASTILWLAADPVRGHCPAVAKPVQLFGARDFAAVTNVIEALA